MVLFSSKTVAEGLREASSLLKEAGVGFAELEAQALAAHVFSMSRLQLLAELHRLTFNPDQLVTFRNSVQRRALGEPIAYIFNQATFLDHDLYVDSRVLIPRPDTELLFETAASLFDPNQGSWMDIGTGSGAIAIAAAARFPHATIIATDRSLHALEVAKRNGASFSNLAFYHSDLMRDLPPSLPNPFLITANLPYIPTHLIPFLEPHVRQEPEMALDGGEDGMVLIRSLIEQAAQRRIPMLALEIGDGQDQAVIHFLKQHGYLTRHCLPCIDGPIRVITATHKQIFLSHG